MSDHKKNECAEKDQEILDRIKENAKDIEIPQSLRPEEVTKRLKSDQKRRNKEHWRVLAPTIGGIASAAACVALIAGMLVSQFGVQRDGRNAHLLGMNSEMKEGDVQTDAQKSSEDMQEYEEKGSEKNNSIGKNIILAKTENEIYELYDRIKDSRSEMRFFSQKDGDIDSMTEGVITNGQAKKGSLNGMQDRKEEKDVQGDFSETNRMEKDLDESDGIKTDGNYIYTCGDHVVNIVDIRDKKMKKTGKVKPKLEKDEDIQEIYVDQKQLYIISEKRGDILCFGVEDDVEENTGKESDAAEEGDMDKGFMRLTTYDISLPEKPVFKGSVKQDGNYLTSRKTGEHIYLFSSIYTNCCGNEKDLLPEINGEKVPADSVYLAKNETDQELVVSSVDTGEAGKVHDQLALVCDAYEVYMDSESIYLYSGKYGNMEKNEEENEKDKESSADNRVYTRIVKLSYKDGKLNGENSVNVPGEITDPFAIHGSGQGLEVLTTEFGYNDASQTSNRLTLFDGNLKQTAQIDGIAKGEEIYAARYLDNLVYFVTYHNTDPLFAVNLEDRANPEILGYTKISGYSEYLHPFGSHEMLGIGYETDPESGEQKGIKISMFDTTDPRHIKVLDSKVKKYDEIGADSDYKAVLADPEKNLIGFYAYNFKSGENNYLIYAWEKHKLKLKAELKNQTSSAYDIYRSRGLYAGNRFYTVGLQWTDDKDYTITSYDMDQSFKKTDSITCR